MEEDLFHRLAVPADRPGALGPKLRLSIAAARILATQLREAVAQRHALAVARVGVSTACPLDLHALLPVPDAVLRLGPDDPASLTWLWTHWGTTQALRHVTVAPVPADGYAEAGRCYRFWSADWTPWRAIAAICVGWPNLHVTVQPRYTP